MLADGERGVSPPAVRFDPLVHPVSITGQCVIGDQLRIPALWCAMVSCDAGFTDPDALGEADNRARAIAAGWAEDALGRMVCPACQLTHPVPVWWVLARSAPAGRPPAVSQDRQHRAHWPRLLSALAAPDKPRHVNAG